MAIVCVLWGVVLLAVIAGAILPAGKTSYQLAHNALVAARTDAVAEAAVNRAVLALLDLRPEMRWRVDGVPQVFSFDGTPVRISIQDETGRIDLNRADGSLLVGLFQSAGLDPQAAANLVDKILDWRDASPMKRLNGAKEADYRAAGRSYGPRNGPFQSVDELRLVLDMTPKLFQRVEGALTVYSGRQFIDPQVAPPEALLALPTMDAARVAAVLAARAQQGAASGSALPGDVVDPLNPFKGRAFSIHAEIANPAGVVTRDAAVRLTGDPAQPYWVLRWTTR